MQWTIVKLHVHVYAYIVGRHCMYSKIFILISLDTTLLFCIHFRHWRLLADKDCQVPFLHLGGYLKHRTKQNFSEIKTGYKFMKCCSLLLPPFTLILYYRFWSLLFPYCSTSRLCGLPLVSSFGRGFGEMLMVDGKVRLE